MASIDDLIKEHSEVIDKLYNKLNVINDVIGKITYCFKSGNKILVCGNGGSAADAGHIVGEFVGRLKKERDALSAIDLTSCVPSLTAIGNDYGFEDVFAKGVQAYARKGDILWGISTSGNSENIIRAFKIGREIGAYNFSMTGRDGGRIRKENLSDLNINIYSDNTPRIQEAHELIYHIICEKVEEKMVGYKNGKK
jgi:D-sedoheptulose 7-phosphate isomerase